MSNLLASLGVSGNALNVMQQALNVIQNNVANANTPGYASQSLNLAGLPFDLTSGALGGVASQGLDSSRDSYLDTEVQRQLQSLGHFTSQAQSTSVIQSFFDPTASTGVASTLTQLFSAFSAWSAAPTDSSAGQAVISAASSFAGAVQTLSKALNSTALDLNSQVSSTVTKINTIASQIEQYNELKMKGVPDNPSADAALENNLENLSQLTNFTAFTQANGSVTILAGNGEPLVIGDKVNQLSFGASVDSPGANPQSAPTAHVYDAAGTDITSSITGGSLGGLLDSRNRVLSSIIGDSQQQGSLNKFAQGIADTVNNILEAGTVSTATGAASGIALFTYDSSDATHAAGSLNINSAITPAQLAPVDASGVANGAATALAQLANPNNPQIGGEDFTTYFADIASTAGQENQTATNNQTTQQSVVTQAQALRDSISGVSLDTQAANLLEFQRSYQAVSRVLTIVNTLADSILNLIPQV